MEEETETITVRSVLTYVEEECKNVPEMNEAGAWMAKGVEKAPVCT
jgi:hypothetical protein